MKKLILLLLFCAFGVSWATAWAQGTFNRRGLEVVAEANRYALLIGVNEYPDNVKSLNYCVKDMTDLSATLQKIGFPKENITLMIDDAETGLTPTGENIRQQVKKFLEARQPGDFLLVAYSGHGVEIDSRAYLCPADVDKSKRESFVDREQIFDQLKACPALQKIFLCDCCRDKFDLESNSDKQFADGKSFTSRAISDQSQSDRDGFVMFSSCRSAQTSREVEQLQHGVFTHFFIEGLRGAAKDRYGFVTVSGLFNYIDSEMRHNRYTQVPTLQWGGEMSNIVLVRASGLNFISFGLYVLPLLALLAGGIAYLCLRARPKAVPALVQGETTGDSAEEEQHRREAQERERLAAEIRDQLKAEEQRKAQEREQLEAKVRQELAEERERAEAEKRRKKAEELAQAEAKKRQQEAEEQARLRPELNIPSNPDEVKIDTYTVHGINVKFHAVSAPEPAAKVTAGKIQLPPIPDSIRNLKAKNRSIDEAIALMQTGQHEALKDAHTLISQAREQYTKIRKQRDEQWQPLSGATRTELESRIAQEPNGDPVALKSLKPTDLGLSAFIKLVYWGQKAQQAKGEMERVQKDVEAKIQSEIARMEQERQANIQQAQTDEVAFRKMVLMTLLKNSKGYSSLQAKLDYDFLADAIPSLLKYNLGWTEDQLWEDVVLLWHCEREVIPASERQKVQLESTIESGCKAGDRWVKTINGVEFAFRWCPAGEFMMGSPGSEPGRFYRETQHRVTIRKGFWMMETQVTVGMFKAFVQDTGYESQGYTPWGWNGRKQKLKSYYSWRNPGFTQDDRHPVTCVSWNDAQAFCKWLSEKLGQKISLPSEAQWEYACRAGTTGPYAGDLDDMAWYDSKSGTHPVGTKKANAWGLCDMHGNVWEWCQDVYQENISSNSTEESVGGSNGAYRVLRGGGWSDFAQDCRSACRSSRSPEFRDCILGLRCVGQ